MGCDGGTIPRRDELVRQKKKPEQKDKNAETVAKWKHCAISQEPLQKPIVSCELGRLYNKEKVIEHILNKEKTASSEVASHITKLSDVKELNLTEKSQFDAKKDQKGDEYVDFCTSRYICPVTSIDMNGRQRFYFMWKCGCVVSERAMKEIKSETCHKCGNPVNENDIIIINGSDQEIEVLRSKMTERRHLSKLEKKKRKAAASTQVHDEKKIKVEPEEPIASTSRGCSSNAESKCDVKVKPAQNGNRLNGEHKSKFGDLPEKAQKKYSIAKDPAASDAYKSLFTSHKNAKNQVKAHWVTHNPCYF